MFKRVQVSVQNSTKKYKKVLSESTWKTVWDICRGIQLVSCIYGLILDVLRFEQIWQSNFLLCTGIESLNEYCYISYLQYRKFQFFFFLLDLLSTFMKYWKRFSLSNFFWRLYYLPFWILWLILLDQRKMILIGVLL